MGEGNREGETDFPVFGKGILFYPIFEASDSFAEYESPQSFLYERLKCGKLSLSLTAVRGFLITHAIPLVLNTTKLLLTELKRTAALYSTAEL